MSRRTRPAQRPAAPRVVQTELFPRELLVERLDPSRVGGARTRVAGVYLAREHAAAPPHRVFHDRHGWYCEQHGRACDVVAEVRRAVAPDGPA